MTSHKIESLISLSERKQKKALLCIHVFLYSFDQNDVTINRRVSVIDETLKELLRRLNISPPISQVTAENHSCF